MKANPHTHITSYVVRQIEKQREWHILPCYEKLSESEIDCIAHELGLEKYNVKEKTVENGTDRGWKFDYYHYILTY